MPKRNDFLEEMIDRLKNLISYHDSPISTISYLVHSLISERISKTSSKVVVSGTGADELFTGYYDHYLFSGFSIFSSSFLSIFSVFFDTPTKDGLNSLSLIVKPF